MRSVVWTNAFKKDYKLVLKRNFAIEKIKNIITLLAADEALPFKARPHKLSGEYVGIWECHIAPDWLLLYEYTYDQLILRRTGTHADLFK